MRLRNRVSAAVEESLPLEQALSILRRDILNLVPAGGTFFGAFESNSATNGVAGQIGPDLYTTSGQLEDRVPWGEVQKVGYALLAPGNGHVGMDLVRMITRSFLTTTTETPLAQPLLQGVRNLNFQYYDGTQWIETWDSTTQTNMPQAIKVRMQMISPEGQHALVQPAPIEMVVPVVVMMLSTNSTTTASTSGTGGNP